MTEAFAPVASTASHTVLKTGTPSTVWPALPGVTPATIFVPYSSICFVWNVAALPVMPCTMTFVSLLTKIPIENAPFTPALLL